MKQIKHFCHENAEMNQTQNVLSALREGALCALCIPPSVLSLSLSTVSRSQPPFLYMYRRATLMHHMHCKIFRKLIRMTSNTVCFNTVGILFSISAVHSFVGSSIRSFVSRNHCISFDL